MTYMTKTNTLNSKKQPKNSIPSNAILGDSERFKFACDLARIYAYDDSLPSEIGRLSERRLHSVLKFYYENDRTCHEQKVGRFVADILTGNEIIEVQTGNLGLLSRKLDFFLKEHRVTVVHPLAKSKTITRIDAETGETLSRRKSSHHANIFDAVAPLYKIKPYLNNKNLAVRFVFLSLEEFRTPNIAKKWGRHHGSVRLEYFPEELCYEIELACSEDYLIFLPDGLPEAFTSADVKRLTNCSDASTLMNILAAVGVIEKIGKDGRFFLYKKCL